MRAELEPILYLSLSLLGGPNFVSGKNSVNYCQAFITDVLFPHKIKVTVNGYKSTLILWLLQNGLEQSFPEGQKMTTSYPQKKQTFLEMILIYKMEKML